MDGTSSAPDWRIPDDLWKEIEWLLPEHKNTHRFGGGRRRTADPPSSLRRRFYFLADMSSILAVAAPFLMMSITFRMSSFFS